MGHQRGGDGPVHGHADLALAGRDQLVQGAGVGGVRERDGHPRVGEPEGADERRHRVDDQGGERDQVEPSPFEPGDGGDRGLTDLDVAQHLPGRADERLTRRA